jgi:hypothetical protein
MINWTEFGRKLLWPDQGTKDRHFPVGTEANHRVVNVLAEI